MRETLKWVLIGTSIIFVVTTILTFTGLAAALGEDEDVLLFLRITSLTASIVSAIGLLVT